MVISIDKIEVEFFEWRTLLEKELLNCMMGELDQFLFLIDLNEVLTPGCDAVDVVWLSLWLGVPLPNFNRKCFFKFNKRHRSVGSSYPLKGFQGNIFIARMYNSTKGPIEGPGQVSWKVENSFPNIVIAVLCAELIDLK
jgi:hypothetical protein